MAQSAAKDVGIECFSDLVVPRQSRFRRSVVYQDANCAAQYLTSFINAVQDHMRLSTVQSPLVSRSMARALKTTLNNLSGDQTYLGACAVAHPSPCAFAPAHELHYVLRVRE